MNIVEEKIKLDWKNEPPQKSCFSRYMHGSTKNKAHTFFGNILINVKILNVTTSPKFFLKSGENLHTKTKVYEFLNG